MVIYLILILLISAPFVVTLVVKKLMRKSLNLLALSGLSALVIYILLLISVQVIAFKLQMELDQFDLNGDGFFSGEEITLKMEEAQKRVANNTGAGLAPITGALFCLTYFMVLYVIGKVTAFIKKKLWK